MAATVSARVGRARARLLSEAAGLSGVSKPWRRRLMRWAGADVDSGPGRNFRFAGSHANLHVGRGTYMNRAVFIEAVAPVRIGNGCHFGMESMVLTSHHPLDESGVWTFAAEGRPVSIGDRVWVGARAVILPGAVIDSNVIIAAAAVVSGHCAANGLYAGVPAKRIRELSSDSKSQSSG